MSDPAVTPAEVTGTAPRRVPSWVLGAGPLVLLGLVVALFLRAGPVGVFTRAFPPVEELTIDRVTLPAPGLMEISVINGGPEAVTIAQLLVDEAAWVHTIDGDRTLGRLERRTIRAPYPWVEGEPHTITLVTGTGLTFSHTIPVSVETPRADARYLSTFALLGIYAGVIPVMLGLLWLPFLRRLGRQWLDFFLAFTVGLLIFLGVDALEEAFETSARVAGSLQGGGLILLGVLGTPLALAALSPRAARTAAGPTRLQLAALVAIAIGLHNLGEGLAIGSSYATGEIALGTFLVVGFLIHNTTEGLGIVAPLGSERPGIARLLALGAVAGVPTVIGAWIGGFSSSPFWTTLFFAVGAGAIVQVVYQLGRLLLGGERRVLAPLNALGMLAGLAMMYATGVLVGG